MNREEQKKVAEKLKEILEFHRVRLLPLPKWEKAIEEQSSQIDKIYHPEPKPCPDHIIKDASEVTAIWDFEGKQPAEQPEMKRDDKELKKQISQAIHCCPDIKPKSCVRGTGDCLECQKVNVKKLIEEILAADKSHCAECKGRQDVERLEKEIFKLKDEYKSLSALDVIHIKEITFLKSQLNKQEEL